MSTSTLLKLTRIHSLLDIATPQEIEIAHYYINNLVQAKIPNAALLVQEPEKPKIPLENVHLASEMGWGSE